MLINIRAFGLFVFSFLSLSCVPLYAEILPAASTLTAITENLQLEHFTQTRTSVKSAATPMSSISNLIDIDEEEITPMQIDTGYNIAVQENLDVYLTTRLTTLNENDNSVGLSGGVDYQLTNNLILSSGLTQQALNFKNETDSSGNQTILEFSSSYQLTDKLHFFATYDHQIEQNTTDKNYRIGVGFRF